MHQNQITKSEMHQNIELKFILAHSGGVWPCDLQLTF